MRALPAPPLKSGLELWWTEPVKQCFHGRGVPVRNPWRQRPDEQLVRLLHEPVAVRGLHTRVSQGPKRWRVRLHIGGDRLGGGIDIENTEVMN